MFQSSLRCTCCKDCGKRKLGCHANCIDYLKFKKETKEKSLEEKRQTSFMLYRYANSTDSRYA
jgi:hypothetical protein